MSKVRKPALDQRVVAPQGLDDKPVMGVVIGLLASQFVYEDAKGNHLYCLYSQDWKPA